MVEDWWAGGKAPFAVQVAKLTHFEQSSQMSQLWKSSFHQLHMAVRRDQTPGNLVGEAGMGASWCRGRVS